MTAPLLRLPLVFATPTIFNPPARCKKFIEEFVRTDEGIDFEDQYTYKDQLVGPHLLRSPTPPLHRAHVFVKRFQLDPSPALLPPFSRPLYRFRCSRPTRYRAARARGLQTVTVLAQKRLKIALCAHFAAIGR